MKFHAESEASFATDEFRKYLEERVFHEMEKVMAQREEVLAAFIAKYGYEPDRLVQVVQNLPGKVEWWVRRRSDEEMVRLSMDGASL